MRLFIAIHPDPGWIRHLTGCQHQLVQAGLQGRLVPRENLHMTLAFAGNCTQDQKDTILHLLQTLSFPATDARCLGYHRFGNTRVLAFQADPAMTSFVQELRERLRDAGIPLDDKPWKPHITLARGCAPLQHPFPAPECPSLMPLSSPVLYESIQTRQGVAYRPLGRD